MIIIDEKDIMCEWIENGRYNIQSFPQSELISIVDVMSTYIDKQREVRMSLIKQDVIQRAKDRHEENIRRRLDK